MKSLNAKIEVINSVELNKALDLDNNKNRIFASIIVVKTKKSTTLVCKKAEYLFVLNEYGKLLYIHYNNRPDLLERIIGSIILYGANNFAEKIESNTVNGTDMNNIKKMSDMIIAVYYSIILNKSKSQEK